MSLISDEDKKVISEMLNAMDKKAVIAFFTEAEGKGNCTHCKETQNILEEVANISDKVNLKVFNFDTEQDKAKTYGIDNIPAIAILGENEENYGIKFYGVPAGYEFGTLIEDIVMVGKNESGLTQASKDKIKTITKETNIQVFVTPT